MAFQGAMPPGTPRELGAGGGGNIFALGFVKKNHAREGNLKKNKMQKNATSKNHENGIKMAFFNFFEIYEYFRAFPKKI